MNHIRFKKSPEINIVWGWDNIHRNIKQACPLLTPWVYLLWPLLETGYWVRRSLCLNQYSCYYAEAVTSIRVYYDRTDVRKCSRKQRSWKVIWQVMFWQQYWLKYPPFSLTSPTYSHHSHLCACTAVCVATSWTRLENHLDETPLFFPSPFL